MQRYFVLQKGASDQKKSYVLSWTDWTDGKKKYAYFTNYFGELVELLYLWKNNTILVINGAVDVLLSAQFGVWIFNTTKLIVPVHKQPYKDFALIRYPKIGYLS